MVANSRRPVRIHEKRSISLISWTAAVRRAAKICLGRAKRRTFGSSFKTAVQRSDHQFLATVQRVVVRRRRCCSMIQAAPKRVGLDVSCFAVRSGRSLWAACRSSSLRYIVRPSGFTSYIALSPFGYEARIGTIVSRLSWTASRHRKIDNYARLRARRGCVSGYLGQWRSPMTAHLWSSPPERHEHSSAIWRCAKALQSPAATSSDCCGASAAKAKRAPACARRSPSCV